MPTLNQQTYQNTDLAKLDFSSQTITGLECEKVSFQNCVFLQSHFEGCEFIDCVFKNCDFSLITASKSKFIDCKFIASKVVGVNWMKIKGSIGVTLTFENSVLNYSVFENIGFKNSKIYDCECENVTFFDCDLTSCNCQKTNFKGAIFTNTLLYKTDFRAAINYFIDITDNPKLKGAKFSSPEVTNLLKALEIEIEGV
jgi:uncharacterized protein YjbI with pentapeptide repeats